MFVYLTTEVKKILCWGRRECQQSSLTLTSRVIFLLSTSFSHFSFLFSLHPSVSLSCYLDKLPPCWSAKVFFSIYWGQSLPIQELMDIMLEPIKRGDRKKWTLSLVAELPVSKRRVEIVYVMWDSIDKLLSDHTRHLSTLESGVTSTAWEFHPDRIP